jgi:hypothetical protein
MDELKINVSTERDIDATPYDADCYTEEQITAWKNDEWHYVGVIVTVSFQGVEIGNASLWAIDSEDPAYHQEVANELTAEALKDAEGFLKKAHDAWEAHTDH